MYTECQNIYDIRWPGTECFRRKGEGLLNVLDRRVKEGLNVLDRRSKEGVKVLDRRAKEVLNALDSRENEGPNV